MRKASYHDVIIPRFSAMADTAEGDITEALATISRVRNETAKASLEGMIDKGT